MFPIVQNPVLNRIVFEKSMDETGAPCIGEVMYSFFNAGLSKIPGPICVFTASPRNQYYSLINHAEKIIDVICEKEGVLWRNFWFCELRTHPYLRSVPSGNYQFNVLTLGTEDRCVIDVPGRRFGCGRVEVWRSWECPLQVFTIFKNHIGAFPSLEEKKDRIRLTYCGLTDSEFATKMQGACDDAKRTSDLRKQQYDKAMYALLTPTEAFRKGYRFAPLFDRIDAVPRNIRGDRVAVYLGDSHLLGQWTPGQDYESLKTPSPFSYWYPELEWYHL